MSWIDSLDYSPNKPTKDISMMRQMS